MERILTVSGGIGKFDSPEFITSTEESLSIKLVVKNEVREGVYRVLFKHGNADIIEKQIKPNQTMVLFPSWIKKGGNAPIEISMYFLTRDCAKIVNDNYQIEPLSVNTIEGNFEYSSLVQALIHRFDRLENRFVELEKRVQEYETNGIELIAETETITDNE